MYFSCTKTKLLQGLQLVEHAIGKNNSLPILQNVLIKARSRGLEIIGTDLELGIQADISAKVQKEGELALPLKTLVGFVRGVPEGLLECKEQNNTLGIKEGAFHAHIKGEDASQYPLLPRIKKTEGVSVSARVFTKALSTLISSLASSDSKPELTGVFVRVSDGIITTAATDSFRLTERKQPLHAPHEQTFILPGRAAQELARIFSQDESDSPLVWHEGGNQILIEYIPNEKSLISPLSFVSRLIEGQYPQYEAIIPRAGKTTLILSRQDILQHLRGAGLFADKLREVKITLSPKTQKVTLETNDTGTGSYRSELSCAGEGEEQEILLNWQYLIDGLQTMDDTDIRLTCISRDKPVCIEPATQKGHLYVVMPLRPQI